MPKMTATTSTLVMIDLQARLMPVIHDAANVITNARRLIDVAGLLKVPVIFTEQNPTRLGSTVPELPTEGAALVRKMTFDAMDDPGFSQALTDNHSLVIIGVEAHVCVLQTALGLLAAQRKVFVVRDAVGSRHPDSKAAAIERMATQDVEIVTTEMVVFEWLRTAAHPRFREVSGIIR